MLQNSAVMCKCANVQEVDSWLIGRSRRQPGVRNFESGVFLRIKLCSTDQREAVRTEHNHKSMVFFCVINALDYLIPIVYIQLFRQQMKNPHSLFSNNRTVHQQLLNPSTNIKLYCVYFLKANSYYVKLYPFILFSPSLLALLSYHLLFHPSLSSPPPSLQYSLLSAL